MRRGLVFLSILAIPLAVAPGATANRPIREISIQEDVVITDQCAFPVLGHIDGSEIITTFTDRAGNPIRQIGVFPHNTSTLTNLESGESITVVATGPFHAQAEPDGSVSVEASGHSFFLPNP